MFHFDNPWKRQKTKGKYSMSTWTLASLEIFIFVICHFVKDRAYFVSNMKVQQPPTQTVTTYKSLHIFIV